MVCPSWRVARLVRVGGDRGTMIPMIMLCFLLAATFGCASIAASAAFLAQRDLAGACDGAAVAAANAVSRAGIGAAPARLRRQAGSPNGPRSVADNPAGPAGPVVGAVHGAGRQQAVESGLGGTSQVGGAGPGRIRGDRPYRTGGAADPGRLAGVTFGYAGAVGGDDTGSAGMPYGGGGSGSVTGLGVAEPYRSEDPGDDGEVLPLDADAVERAIAEYQVSAAVGGSPIRMSAVTDGQAVTVTCRRTVRVPFGRLLGYSDGLERTAIARARSPLD